MAHYARLRIDMTAWLRTMRAGVFHVQHWPVPDDATLLHVHYDSERHVWWAVFAHDSFAEVEPGAILPELEPATIRVIGG